MQKGSTAFKPFEWQIVLEGVGDVNLLATQENGIVDPDVRDGTDRTTTHAALQEAFVEIHLVNTSVNYDFISTKIGRQPFNSDFRSLIFSDVNQGVRFFGSANANRYQFNLLYFNQAEKDTNSELNTFGLRDQQIAIGNLYIQDFLKLGYTTAVQPALPARRRERRRLRLRQPGLPGATRSRRRRARRTTSTSSTSAGPARGTSAG